MRERDERVRQRRNTLNGKEEKKKKEETCAYYNQDLDVQGTWRSWRSDPNTHTHPISPTNSVANTLIHIGEQRAHIPFSSLLRRSESYELLKFYGAVCASLPPPFRLRRCFDDLEEHGGLTAEAICDDGVLLPSPQHL